MKKISKTLLIYVSILSFGIIGFAQTGRTLSDQSAGYSFIAPAGFTANKNEQGFALVDSTKTYFIIVMSHRYNDAKSFAADANLERDGLTLVGDVQQLGGNDFAFRTYKDTPQGRVIIDKQVRINFVT